MILDWTLFLDGVPLFQGPHWCPALFPSSGGRRTLWSAGQSAGSDRRHFCWPRRRFGVLTCVLILAAYFLVLLSPRFAPREGSYRLQLTLIIIDKTFIIISFISFMFQLTSSDYFSLGVYTVHYTYINFEIHAFLPLRISTLLPYPNPVFFPLPFFCPHLFFLHKRDESFLTEYFLLV